MATSLYRCEACDEVVRHDAGHLLGHFCRAYDDQGNYLGKDAESQFVEFEDDGRIDVEDLRDLTWMADGN